MFFFGLSGAIAIAGEDLVPGHSAIHTSGREDALEIDSAKRRSLSRVVHDDLAKVSASAQDTGDEHPDIDEVLEVSELVELR